MGKRAYRRNRRGPSVNASFAPAGFERIREAGDGNCLFHALARQALGDPRLADQVRKEICDWMEINLPSTATRTGRSILTEEHRCMIAEQREELSSHGFDDEMRILQYVRKMRRQGEWGTGLEVLCAAYHYDRPVHVWSPGGFSELRPPHNGMHAQKLRPETIRVLHNGHNHWDSLVDGESSSSFSAKVPIARKTNHKFSDEHDGDAVLAFAISANLEGCKVEADNDVGPFFTPNDDHQDLRRVLAASAAEERQQRFESRGLGGHRTKTMQVMPQSPVSEPHEVVKSAVVDAMANPHGNTTWRNRWTRRLAHASTDTAAAQDRSTHSCIAVDIEVVEEHASLQSDSSQKHIEAPTDDMHPAVQECVVALSRVGFSLDEAVAILAQSDFDVDQVRLLYAIDWDDEGRTVQTPFAT